MSALHPALRIALILCAAALVACQFGPGVQERARLEGGQQILLTFTQGEKHEGALLNSFGSSYHRQYGTSLSTRSQVDGIVRDYPIREESGWVIDSLGVYCGLFTVAPDTDIEHLLQRLGDDARVESSQLLFNYSTRGEVAYNDPYFELQYGRASEYVRGLHRWSTGKGVDIAVIDTGVDTRHPDLSQQIAESRVFLEGDDHRGETDIHGTAMAGIIAARANNGSGIVGIAPDARLHAFKACRQLDDRSSQAECDSFTLARALNFAIGREVELINLSLSGPLDPLISRLIAAALAQGLTVTAADPGSGSDRYPALLPGVIAVREDGPASEAGAVIPEALVVHAPRREILSTGPGGSYDFFSGSSVATAMVTGLTALLIQRDAELSAEQRVAWLNTTIRRDISPGAPPDEQLPLADTAHQVQTGPTLLEF